MSNAAIFFYLGGISEKSDTIRRPRSAAYIHVQFHCSKRYPEILIIMTLAEVSVWFSLRYHHIMILAPQSAAKVRKKDTSYTFQNLLFSCDHHLSPYHLIEIYLRSVALM